jgi:hypothetical protein
MQYYDFSWDLTPEQMIFDEDLPLHKLGWNEGDYFKLVVDDETGTKKLVKQNELEKFILQGTIK